MGRYFLLQGIFPTQGSNPSLLHCRQILYRLSHEGSFYTYTDICASQILFPCRLVQNTEQSSLLCTVIGSLSVICFLGTSFYSEELEMGYWNEKQRNSAWSRWLLLFQERNSCCGCHWSVNHRPPQRNSSPTVTHTQLILFPSLVKALAPRDICPLGRHLLKIYPLKQNFEHKLPFPATYTKIIIFL